MLDVGVFGRMKRRIVQQRAMNGRIEALFLQEKNNVKEQIAGKSVFEYHIDEKYKKKIKDAFFLIDSYFASATYCYNVLAFNLCGIESFWCNDYSTCRVNPLKCHGITENPSFVEIFQSFVVEPFPLRKEKRKTILTPKQLELKKSRNEMKQIEKQRKKPLTKQVSDKPQKVLRFRLLRFSK
ncbi:hypothetical protein EIN_145930 [Entamoeba invadens IP1]|uniref:Uncharacterized protein n=1 Tax=Entamoeba invadens IP1 TaxID=370355 RepID=L7FN87_ENTIV|nr:hypothetical protein EIN_145930 [Entamoeba invadens IP1]ELP87609.1 hypothetical protein EIN_145930 [Entamoeba invadens IP1]|eukprot:XP_004254380.1 hypothetical protein EIN_145930 [Entamoeba invadens IP1]